MKKIVVLCMIICLFGFSCVLGTNDFADEENTEQGEVVESEVASSEALEENNIEQETISTDVDEDDNAVYLNSYEDIYNAFSGVDSNALYKEEYQKMIDDEILNYNSTERDEVVKAKITKVEDPEYYYPSSGYDVYKLKYQKITVEILEGKQKGKTFDTEYVLTADSYENLSIRPVKVGQVINVVIDDSTGEEIAYATTLDASIVKAPAIIVVILIATACIALCLGKYGLKILPQLVLIGDLILFVFVPEVYAGSNILWITVLSCLAYVIVETIMKLGIHPKTTFAAMTTSLAIVVVFGLALHVFYSLNGFEGISLEVANIVETYPRGDIDFYLLSICIFMLMLTPIISNIACQTLKVYDENDDKVAREKIKKYTAGMIPIIVVIILVVSIQKFLYLKVLKYTPGELMNSEIMMTDFVRGAFIVIASCVTPLVGERARKLF